MMMDGSGNNGTTGGLGQSGTALFVAAGVALLLTVLIALLTPLLGRFENPSAGLITTDSSLPADQRAGHYEWKLNNPDLWTRLTSWGGYALQQIASWAMIVWGLRIKSRQKKEGGGTEKFARDLSKPGIGFFVVSLAGYFLHLVQTQLFYDGIAQDVAVFSSQASVVVMLILVLIMLNDRRGLFFGKKIPMPAKAVAFIKKYHGFYISWALVYTFWFHPMTGTLGHLVGFFYMFILMIQGGLMYTRAHLNPRWHVLLEAFVLIHGVTVALVLQNSTMWTMFFAGFGFMFVVTQLYGLKLKSWLNAVLTGLYVLALVVIYSGILVPGKSFVQLHQVLWIPMVLYLLIPVFWLVGMAGQKILDLAAKKENAGS